MGRKVGRVVEPGVTAGRVKTCWKRPPRQEIQWLFKGLIRVPRTEMALAHALIRVSVTIIPSCRTRNRKI